MTKTAMSVVLALAGASLAFAACGGTAVVDGGSGGSGTGTGTTTGTPTTTTTTGTPCTTHADCGDRVCVFATGTCAEPCEDFCEGCGSGSICNDCATSSCPQCLDCVAACVPIQPGQCDDDDACAGGEVCLFFADTCAPSCESSDCADPNMVCQDCASSSCCGCKDCVSACLPF